MKAYGDSVVYCVGCGLIAASADKFPLRATHPLVTHGRHQDLPTWDSACVCGQGKMCSDARFFEEYLNAGRDEQDLLCRAPSGRAGRPVRDRNLTRERVPGTQQ